MKVALLTTDNREQQNRYDVEYPYFGPAIESLLQGFETLGDEIEVHVISCARRPMPAPQKLAPNIWFHQPVVPHIGWGRTLFVGCAWKVRKLIRKINPDMVHGQGTERDCSTSAVLAGFPTVLTIHGIMQAVARIYGAKPLSYYGMISGLERFAIGRADGVLCNTKYTESWIASRANKTWRVPNCLRQPFVLAPPPIGERPRRIVVVGSIAHYKQPLEILQLWQRIGSESGDVELVFVGQNSGGPYGDRFGNLLQHPSLQGRTRHIDWLDPEDLIQLLDQSRGMIHFPTEESFGLAVAEGLARNLKLFAARTGGIPEVVVGSDAVELFDMSDWDGLQKGVTAWMDNEMPTPNNWQHIVDTYSPRAVAEMNVRIYHEVLQNRLNPN